MDQQGTLVRTRIAGIAALLGAVSVVAYLVFFPVVRGDGVPEAADLRVNFGLRTLPLTRSLVVNLCPDPLPPNPQRECEQNPPDPGAPTTTELTSPNRPGVISARVVGDLVRVDKDKPYKDEDADFVECNPTGDGDQFPASQIPVAAENGGRQSLLVSLSADPREPEVVGFGMYCGQVIVERSLGRSVRLDLIVTLGDRGQAPLVARVFGALLAGALVGAAVKWLGDTYVLIVALRRRQRRLTRRLGPWRGQLPEVVRNDLDIIDDGIRHGDPDGLDSKLTTIESQSNDLAQFGEEMHVFAQFLTGHRRLVGTASDTPPIATLIAAEENAADALLKAKYPWSADSNILEDAARLRNNARLLTAALGPPVDPVAYRAAAKQILGTEGFDAAMSSPATASAIEPVATERVADNARRPGRRSFFQTMLDGSLVLTAVVSAVVVALVGYQTEFLKDESFNAKGGDLLELFGWALAIQLAGTTIAQVGGRLLNTRPTTPSA